MLSLSLLLLLFKQDSKLAMPMERTMMMMMMMTDPRVNFRMRSLAERDQAKFGETGSTRPSRIHVTRDCSQARASLKMAVEK